jgi:hypothetical protein
MLSSVHSQNPNHLCCSLHPSLYLGVILLSGLKLKRYFYELEVQVFCLQVVKICEFGLPKSDSIVAGIVKIDLAMFSYC